MEKYKHLNLEQRKTIEKMYANCVSYRKIAEQIGVSPSSVLNEVRRGSVNGVYRAETAQEYAEKQRAKNRRVPIIRNNRKLQDFISRKILNEGKSPEQITLELQRLEGDDLGVVSYNTIYAAIKRGYIPGVTMQTLRQNIATVQRDMSIYIPKWFIEEYGLKQGQQFELLVEENKIILKMLKKVEDHL